ncbi:MAG: Rne/Rng family ribonuclease [Sterolibacterium sp.]|nr:Rne/Rng family ribonuclease [Sterolibacterium sp.]
MKRMLFNATQAEELRVAIVDGQKLVDLDIESANKEQRKSNIYKAVITRIEPSLEAAFVEYGAERHGFLPFKEVARAYFKPDIEPGKARIQDALQVGQEIIVQVDKDERGNKGAALTTFISLAGRYLVLMPNNPRGGGVSRRVEGDDRQELREIMDRLEVPASTSLIARTAAIGRSFEELQWDLNYLLQLWSAIENAASSQKGAFLIYQESSLVIRAIRDYFHSEIGEILIDTDDVFEQAHQFMSHVMPGNVSRVKRYRDDVPLFSRFQIEHQIESAYSRQVILPSGGAIVIDHTEALVSVDVNSGRATKGADIEETAFKTNLEAADETARQLRLRDLGGLIVIDFIDMESARNQREVENRLRDALHHDRARVQTGKISRFGLLELSRQRLRPTLAETSYIPCPRCNGTGHTRSTESSALHILRILEEEAMKENTGALHCQIPVDVATFLLNEKRADIAKIEMRHKVNLVLIPNINLETPQHTIVRLRHDQLNLEDIALPSYKMVDGPTEESYTPPSAQNDEKPVRQEAAVKGITSGQPAPIVEPKPIAKAGSAPTSSASGFFAKIISWFSGETKAEPVVPEKKSGRPTRESRGDGRRGDRSRPERDRGPRVDRDRNGTRPPRNETPALADKTEVQPKSQRSRGEKREDRPVGEPRAAREPRPPRAPKPQVIEQDSPAAETAVGVVARDETDAPQQGKDGQRARRGRRGSRSERGEKRAEELSTEQINVPVDAAPLVTITTVANPPSPAEPAPASVPATSPAEPLDSPPAEPPAAITAQPVHALPSTTSSPVMAKAEFAAVSMSTVETLSPVAPSTPPADLSATLETAGLVLIETSSAPSVVETSVSPQPLGRKPRPPAVIPSEPLQMVETRQD